MSSPTHWATTALDIHSKTFFRATSSHQVGLQDEARREWRHQTFQIPHRCLQKYHIGLQKWTTSRCQKGYLCTCAWPGHSPHDPGSQGYWRSPACHRDIPVAYTKAAIECDADISMYTPNVMTPTQEKRAAGDPSTVLKLQLSLMAWIKSADFGATCHSRIWSPSLHAL